MAQSVSPKQRAWGRHGGSEGAVGLWRAWGRAVGVQGSESADLYLKGLTPGSCSPTSTPGSAWLGQQCPQGHQGHRCLAPGATRRRRSYLLSHRAPLAASSGGGRRTAVFGDPACLRPGHLQGQKPTAVAPPGRLLACVFSAGNHVLYPRLMCEILDLCPQSPVKIFPPGHPTTVRSVSLASSINFIGHHRPRNQDK